MQEIMIEKVKIQAHGYDIPRAVQEVTDIVNKFIKHPTRGTIWDRNPERDKFMGEDKDFKLDYYYFRKETSCGPGMEDGPNWALGSNIEDGNPAYIYNPEEDAWYSREWMSEYGDHLLENATVNGIAEELIMFIAP